MGTGGAAAGGHAEFMPAPADATMLLPDGLAYEQAAPIFCAGYTVWSGFRWADPQPHERVAVVGIGGLGHLAVQYAKAAGFETIAVSHSPDKDAFIRELGADGIVRDGKGLAAAGGVDVVLATYLYEALDYAAKGKVKVVAETFSLNEINKAYDRVAEGKVRFRAVIVN